MYRSHSRKLGLGGRSSRRPFSVGAFGMFDVNTEEFQTDLLVEFDTTVEFRLYDSFHVYQLAQVNIYIFGNLF